MTRKNYERPIERVAELSRTWRRTHGHKPELGDLWPFLEGEEKAALLGLREKSRLIRVNPLREKTV